LAASRDEALAALEGTTKTLRATQVKAQDAVTEMLEMVSASDKQLAQTWAEAHRTVKCMQRWGRLFFLIYINYLEGENQANNKERSSKHSSKDKRSSEARQKELEAKLSRNVCAWLRLAMELRQATFERKQSEEMSGIKKKHRVMRRWTKLASRSKVSVAVDANQRSANCCWEWGRLSMLLELCVLEKAQKAAFHTSRARAHVLQRWARFFVLGTLQATTAQKAADKNSDKSIQVGKTCTVNTSCC